MIHDCCYSAAVADPDKVIKKEEWIVFLLLPSLPTVTSPKLCDFCIIHESIATVTIRTLLKNFIVKK